MQEHHVSKTPANDEEMSDYYFDIAQTDKRLVRASVKTYDKTGMYIALKLFKCPFGSTEFVRQQYVALSVAELEELQRQIPYILSWGDNVDSDKENHISTTVPDEQNKPASRAVKQQRKRTTASAADDDSNGETNMGGGGRHTKKRRIVPVVQQDGNSQNI